MYNVKDDCYCCKNRNCGFICKHNKVTISIPATHENVCSELMLGILDSKLVDVVSDGVVYNVIYSGWRHGLREDTIVNIFKEAFEGGILVNNRNLKFVEYVMHLDTFDYKIELRFINSVERFN